MIFAVLVVLNCEVFYYNFNNHDIFVTVRLLMNVIASFKVERVAWAVANVSMTTVSWLVVIVTLARYCAICRPLDTLQIGRSKRVRKVCTFHVLSSVR